MEFDCIVVGAGIEGSSTAYQLAKAGKKTLLLEQFLLPHTRGSSHGGSRISRKSYGKQEYYTLMMIEAYRLWELLEKESNETLHINVGCLGVGDKNDPFLRETINCLSRHKFPYEELAHSALKRRYPMLKIKEDFYGVLDHSGGILLADKALGCYQRRFKELGGILHDGEPFKGYENGSIITVRTSKRTYRTKSLVLTVGPWAKTLLPSLGLNIKLRPIKVLCVYWKETVPGAYDSQHFPTFFEQGKDDDHCEYYALPSLEYPGHVKVCFHAGVEVDPDVRDKTPDDPTVIDGMKKYISDHFVALEDTPSILEPCIYTLSEDRNFIIDRHPDSHNVIIGAGFSGHGFKLAPVVGKILAELAMDIKPSYDLSHFRIDRFNRSKL